MVQDLIRDSLTDYETEMVINHFGKSNLHIGNVQSSNGASAKSFCLYPSGETVTLNVVFPKPEKTELRLYISSRAGFKPDSGDIWFMFLGSQQIWIGSMKEAIWRSASSDLKQDDSDDIYQNEVKDSDAIRIIKLKERDAYARDRNIAIQRMKHSGYTCEFDNTHNLFISRFSKRPYLEVHHLVPLGLQKDYAKPLDTIHNVFCLCPTCHRAVHHADEPFARKILSTLATKGPILDDFSLTIPDLFGLYAVEEID
jgi:5-methylcytosine-specific restriction endonuclease McrA